MAAPAVLEACGSTRQGRLPGREHRTTGRSGRIVGAFTVCETACPRAGRDGRVRSSSRCVTRTDPTSRGACRSRSGGRSCSATRGYGTSTASGGPPPPRRRGRARCGTRSRRRSASTGRPIPFWAFAWAGGLALARYVQEHPDEVAGRTVLDFATGSGLVAIVAAQAGADHVAAVDVDPFAEAAVALNARANHVHVAYSTRDLLDEPPPAVDVLLAADTWYEGPLADRVLPWLHAAAAQGIARPRRRPRQEVPPAARGRGSPGARGVAGPHDDDPRGPRDRRGPRLRPAAALGWVPVQPHSERGRRCPKPFPASCATAIAASARRATRPSASATAGSRRTASDRRRS